MIKGILYRLRLPDLALLHISPTVEACLGYSASELLADPGAFAAAMPPAERALLEEIARDGGDDDVVLDLTLQHKNGSPRRFKNQACREADGGALAGILFEITTGAPLAPGDARLTELVQKSPAPVALLDRDGRIA